MAIAIIGTTTAWAEEIVYVNTNAVGANDGSSWEDAYVDLQYGLDAAEASEASAVEIWVAAGTYTPSRRTDPEDPRSATFRLISGVRMYGGFEGSESDRSERDKDANVTIVTGDLEGDDGVDFRGYSENVYHVVTARDVDSSTVLDGFTITSGNANRPSRYGFGGGLLCEAADLTVRDCIFRDNVAGSLEEIDLSRDGTVAHPLTGGAGMRIDYESSPLVEGCRFVSNATDGGGGGIHSHGCPTIANCEFVGNVARLAGGLAHWTDYCPSSPAGAYSVSGCSFHSNRSTHEGGGLYISGADRRIYSCVFEDNEAPMGGAIMVEERSTVTVQDTTMIANRAYESGGGIYSKNVDGLKLRDCVLSDNTAQFGGALYGRAEVARCRFQKNLADRGGAIASFSYDRVAVRDSIFESNRAWNGGAVYAYANAEIARCVFRDNFADRGGAMSAYDTHLTVAHSLFESNGARQGGAINGQTGQLHLRASVFRRNFAADGGGLWIDGSVAVTADSLFQGNYANGSGGAIAQSTGTHTIRGCTLVDNEANGLAGGIIAGGLTDIRNCILWGNNAGHEVDEFSQIVRGPDATVQHSCIQGWTGEVGETTNFGLDPMFVDPDGPDDVPGNEDDNFRLRVDSPCVDAGNLSFVAQPGEGDLDGHARVLCGRVDVGAYELGIGDFFCDGVVDLDDFRGWNVCGVGPSEARSGGKCAAFDFDADGDADLSDFAGFQRVFGSP